MKVRRQWLLAGVGLVVAVAGLVSYTAHKRHMTLAVMMATDTQIDTQADVRNYALSRAAPIYKSHCASCHGVDMRGDPSIGAPNLIDADWLFNDGSLIALERTIAYGIRSHHPKAVDLADMPAFAQASPYRRYVMESLAPNDIADVVEYMFDIEGRGSKDDAAVERGRTVFNGKGQCFDCHSLDAEGDAYIGAPNLRDNIWLYGDGSRNAIAQSIAQGRKGACPAWTEVLSPEEPRLLSIYIRDAARRAPSGVSAQKTAASHV